MPTYEPLQEVPPAREGEAGKLGGISFPTPAEPSGDTFIDANEHFSDEARQQRMQMAILNIMDGAVARGRNLKYWENLRLKPVHMQMLLMKAAGYPQKKIAELLDYDESRVSVIVNHPDAQYLLSHLVSFQAEALLDVKTRIQAHAGEALDTALMIMRTGKEENRLKASFNLLNSAGYGGIQKSESTVKFEMPASQAANLTAAMRESKDIEDMTDADFEIIESRAGQGGGTGAPDASSDSYDDEPPVVGHPVQIALRRTA